MFDNITRYCLFALLIFTPLARGCVQEWAITVVHMITVVALASFLLGRCFSGLWKLSKTSLDIPLFLAFMLAVISSLFGVHHVTSFWALALFMNYVVIFYLVVNTFQSRAHTRQLINVVVGMGVFLSVFGMIKMLGKNPFPWWNYDDIPQIANRLSSTFGNPDHMAGYMEMALPITLGLLVTGLKRGKFALAIYSAFVIAAALILTLSRGGWIGALFGLLFLNLILIKAGNVKRKRLIGAISAGFFVFMVIVLYHTSVVERIRTFEQKEELPSLKNRVIAWGGIVKMIRDYPISGLGPGNFATVFTQYQPGRGGRYTMGHNDYLHLTSELGLPFLAVAAFAILLFYRSGLAKMKSPSRRDRGCALGGMSAITAILVHGTVDFNLHIPANAILFTVIAGMVIALRPERDNLEKPNKN